MRVRIALVALALALAGCNQPTSSGEAGGADAPSLDAPAPESEPSRVFAARNDSARNTTGELNVSLAMRMPDAAQENAEAREILTLRGANDLVVEAEINGAVSPATQVGGQTLRALLNIPVEEPQVLVYRVTQETKPSNGQGVCGADAPSFIVVWEPSGSGGGGMKVLGLTGGAPGAEGARACPMLEYGAA